MQLCNIIFVRKVYINRSRQNVYIGIHPATQVWRKVSSYTFSSSVTVGMSTSVSLTAPTGGIVTASGSIGVSASVTHGFSFTKTADESRFSKIAVYCSYDYIAYRGEVRDIYTDEVLHTFYYAIYVKTHEEFKVIYE